MQHAKEKNMTYCLKAIQDGLKQFEFFLEENELFKHFTQTTFLVWCRHMDFKDKHNSNISVFYTVDTKLIIVNNDCELATPNKYFYSCV